MGVQNRHRSSTHFYVLVDGFLSKVVNCLQRCSRCIPSRERRGPSPTECYNAGWSRLGLVCPSISPPLVGCIPRWAGGVRASWAGDRGARGEWGGAGARCRAAAPNAKTSPNPRTRPTSKPKSRQKKPSPPRGKPPRAIHFINTHSVTFYSDVLTFEQSIYLSLWVFISHGNTRILLVSKKIYNHPFFISFYRWILLLFNGLYFCFNVVWLDINILWHFFCISDKNQNMFTPRQLCKTSCMRVGSFVLMWKLKGGRFSPKDQ